MSTLQAYEDLQAKNETEQTSESIIFRVHIPDGSFALFIVPFLYKLHYYYYSKQKNYLRGHHNNN